MFDEVAIYSMREKIPLQKIVTGWVGRGIFLLWARLWLYTLVLRSAVCLLSATNTFTKAAALSMWTTHCSLTCPQGTLKKCREKQGLDKIRVSDDQKLINLLLQEWPVLVLIPACYGPAEPPPRCSSAIARACTWTPSSPTGIWLWNYNTF